MSTKFTPGPWHPEWDEVKGDQFGRVRYQVVSEGKTITRIYYSSFEGGPTNAEADAHLIAAAPMLYEALDEMLGDFAAHSLDSDSNSLTLARAALKAARGES